MNTIVEACLKSITDINESELMGEISACEALLENYEKAARIMEYHGEFNIKPMNVIMEEETAQNAQSTAQPAANTQQQSNTAKTDNNGNKPAWEFDPRRDKKDGSGKESMFWSIIAFIPRLIVAVVRFIGRSIKNLFSGKKASDEAAANVTKTLAEDPSAIYHDKDFLLLLKEAGINDGLPPFKYIQGEYHTGNFENAMIVKDVNGNPLELRIVLPFQMEQVVANMKVLSTEICDGILQMLKNLSPHQTAEGNYEVAPLKNESVKGFQDRIDKFVADLKKQNEHTAKVEEAQNSTQTLLVQLNGEEHSVHTYTPEKIWLNLDALKQIEELINKKNTQIENLIKEFEVNKGKVTPEAGATEALKACAENLKDATTVACAQISKLGTYIQRYQTIITKLSQKFAGGWRFKRAKTTENATDALQASNQGQPQTQQQVQQQVQNPPQNIPQNAGAQGQNPQPQAQSRGLASTDLNRNVPGTGGIIQGIKNLGGAAVQKVKNILPGNQKHYIDFRNPDHPSEIQHEDYDNTKEYQKSLEHLKNSGYEIVKTESYETLIAIDEDGNRHEITMEEYNEHYSDIEIISEQDYLMYYQFENITSLEY